MKKKIIILMLAVVLAVSFTGCSFLLDLFNVPLGIEARILAFQEALNSDSRSATNILANFGPEEDMIDYDDAKDPAVWEEAFPADQSYAFLATSTSDPQDVTVVGTIEDADGNELTPVTYKFVMYEEEDGNFLIQEIWEDPTGSNDPLIRKISFE